RAGRGALEEQLTLRNVSGKRRRSLEFLLSLVEAAELGEQDAAHARQEVVALERALLAECIDELEARGGTKPHRDRDCAIQLHNGRRRDVGERLVKDNDTRPVRLGRGTRS